MAPKKVECSKGCVFHGVTLLWVSLTSHKIFNHTREYGRYFTPGNFTCYYLMPFSPLELYLNAGANVALIKTTEIHNLLLMRIACSTPFPQAIEM